MLPTSIRSPAALPATLPRRRWNGSCTPLPVIRR